MMMYSVPSSFGLAAGVLPEQDAVADLDVEGDQFAVVEPLAMTDSHDFALLRLLLGRIGDDDAVARGFLFVDPLYHDAVVQGSNLHFRNLHLS